MLRLIQENEQAITYDGWQGVSDIRASGGGYRISSTRNDTMTFTFQGSAVRLVMLRANNLGQLQVKIDGVNRGTIDLFKKRRQYGFSKLYDNLGDKKHKLVVTVLASQHPKSKGNGVVIDALQVGESRTEQDSPSLVWNKWKNKVSNAASETSYRFAPRGSVSLTIEGTSVQWLTAKGPAYGQADVYIDGVQQGSRIDLYAPAQAFRVPLAFSNLAAGHHTIEIRAARSKNPASTGKAIVIDGFLIPAP